MLGPNDTALLAELSKLPPLAPFALLTKLDEEAGAAFVWRPGNRAPSAITGGPLGSTVQKAGDRVRIQVQLINAADGYHLWSETRPSVDDEATDRHG